MALFCILILFPLGVIASYLSIPIYWYFQPKNRLSLERNNVYTLCLWAIGLLPITGLTASILMANVVPGSVGGGEPGLNFGYDVIPTFLGMMFLIIPHSAIWFILLSSKKNDK